jgi:hypothetical protein
VFLVALSDLMMAKVSYKHSNLEYTRKEN